MAAADRRRGPYQRGSSTYAARLRRPRPGSGSSRPGRRPEAAPSRSTVPELRPLRRRGSDPCPARRASLPSGPAAGQTRPSEHDGAEGDHTRAPRPAGRHPLTEQGDAGHDRHRVREQRREAGGGENAAALKAELKHDEREPVTGEDERRRDRGARRPRPPPSSPRRPRRRGDLRRCRSPAPARRTGRRSRREARQARRGARPDEHGGDGAVAPVRSDRRQGDREQHEARDRDGERRPAHAGAAVHPSTRHASSASTPTPPADTACTSESGASPSAAT